MLKKILFMTLGTLAIGLTSFAAGAEELHLACVRETATALDVKTLLIGDEQESVALERSSNDDTVVKLKRYAVVITLIPGEGPDGVAREEWEVLSDKQFKLTESPQRPGFDREWSFTIKKSRKTYVCGLNREVHANPALTRNN